MKDYYKTLNISRGASKKKIKDAYLNLISKYNIENYTGDAKKIVENQIAELNEAYSILSDDLLSEKYNNEYDQKFGISKDKDNNANGDLEDQKLKKLKFLKKKKKDVSVGTIGSMTNLTKMIFENLPRFKIDTSKESIFALIASIIIVALVIAILYFLPFTHEFMKNFLYLN